MGWREFILVVSPELILIGTACALLIAGLWPSAAGRRLWPVLATAALVVALAMQVTVSPITQPLEDPVGAFRITPFAQYIKLLAAGISVLLVLLAWPAGPEAKGNTALHFGRDAGEFFALMLLSAAGVMIVAGANDIILLFLGLELTSIPTYILVSLSRPLPAAQEAGVKYFFLGAMSAALMLFGFSYLYGSTGLISLDKLTGYFATQTTGVLAPPALSSWQMLGVLMLIGGLAFKLAAVPLHFYAGDVYEGAATPVTALLSFLPKASGLAALIKLLFVISGGFWSNTPAIAGLILAMAVLTMTVGNVLGLLQRNVKRMLAYSSIAHSGYMLSGLAAAIAPGDGSIAEAAIQGVLFYLAVYGIMNAGAFGVLILLPAGTSRPATSAETLDELAGMGRRHPGLGLAMAAACFSLTGLPLTVGFFGKFYLIRPVLAAQSYWLAAIMVVNAAISAGYYLRVVAVMFLRPAQEQVEEKITMAPSVPVLIAVVLSAIGTVLLGVVLPATELLYTQAMSASVVDQPPARRTVVDFPPE